MQLQFIGAETSLGTRTRFRSYYVSPYLKTRNSFLSVHMRRITMLWNLQFRRKTARKNKELTKATQDMRFLKKREGGLGSAPQVPYFQTPLGTPKSSVSLSASSSANWTSGSPLRGSGAERCSPHY